MQRVKAVEYFSLSRLLRLGWAFVE
ncbi:hypothetical protein J2T17_003349 [Paenibacillus mucilaginosus]